MAAVRFSRSLRVPPGNARSALPRDWRGALARSVRQGPGARQVDDAGCRRALSRLFQEPRDRRDISLLIKLAEESDLRGRIDAMFSGEKINITENRAVLHVWLCELRKDRIDRGGRQECRSGCPCCPRQDGGLRQSRAQGNLEGPYGKRIKTVINIGIGGSDLGPVMVMRLRDYSARNLAFRFVSNVDGTDFVEATRDIKPPRRCSSSRPRPSPRSRR